MEHLVQTSTTMSRTDEDVTDFSALVEVAERHNQLQQSAHEAFSGEDTGLADVCLVNNEHVTVPKKRQRYSAKENDLAKLDKKKKDSSCPEGSSSLSSSPNSSSSESGYISSGSPSISSSNLKFFKFSSSASLTSTLTDESTNKEKVALERQVLLTMTSNAFEQYATDIALTRPLTIAEEKQLKAQRRLISNRESAQASRKRKKAYVEELETKLAEMSNKVSLLQASNASLSAQVVDLEVEANTLRTQTSNGQTNTSDRLNCVDLKRKLSSIQKS